MKKAISIALITAACLFPLISRADCESDTKACEDAKGAAHRCAQTYGFRTEVMCADFNKNVETACARAQNTCGGGAEGVRTPASRKNQ